METYNIRDYLNEEFQEYIVGPRQIGSRGAYLVYGEVEAGEARSLSAGRGHEEIMIVVSGRGLLRYRGGEIVLQPGQVIYLDPDFEGELRAQDTEGVHYVSAGGHIPGGHSH